MAGDVPLRASILAFLEGRGIVCIHELSNCAHYDRLCRHESQFFPAGIRITCCKCENSFDMDSHPITHA